jgi:hypothetical protein
LSRSVENNRLPVAQALLPVWIFVAQALLPVEMSTLVRYAHFWRAVFPVSCGSAKGRWRNGSSRRAKPNPQAAVLVRRYPDTLERLERLATG